MARSQFSSLDVTAFFQAIKHIPQVIGVGRSHCRPEEDNAPCLLVFIQKSRPKQRWSGQHLIPTTWKNKAGVAIKVKVSQLNGPGPEATSLAVADNATDYFRTTIRPVQAGYSFGLAKRIGTLGMVVKVNDGSDNCYFLTSSHVLNLKPNGRKYNIYQPSGTDRLAADEPVAISHWYTRLHKARANFTEAGLAVPIDQKALEVSHPLGEITGVCQQPQVGQQLIKVSRTTGETQGKIIATDWHGWVRFGRRKYPFAKQLLIANDQDPVSKDGDSGSVWLTQKRQAAALNFAGANNGHISISTPLARIFKLFDLKLPTQE